MPVPVTMEDARRQLRILDANQDDEVSGFIDDAAAWVQQYTGHILEARTVTETFGAWDRLQLRAWPIKPGAALTVSYSDDAWNPVVVSGASLDLIDRPARLRPSPTTCWPALTRGSRITVTVRAGYEDNDLVPGNFRRAMLVLIGAYDADREGGDTLAKAEKAARSLLSDYRLRRV